MTAGKYFSKIIFQCKCVLFFLLLFIFNSLTKKCLGEWTFCHCCISMNIHGKSVDMDMDMDGKFHIHGKPGNFWPQRTFQE